MIVYSSAPPLALMSYAVVGSFCHHPDCFAVLKKRKEDSPSGKGSGDHFETPKEA